MSTRTFTNNSIGGGGGAQFERVSNIYLNAELSVEQSNKVFFIGAYMIYVILGSGYIVYKRDANTSQWTLLTTVNGYTGLPAGYGSAPDLSTDGTNLYAQVPSASSSGHFAICQLSILTGTVTNTSLVDDSIAPSALQNVFIDSGKVYAQLNTSPNTWYEATYTPGGSTVGSVSTFGTGFVPTIANMVLSTDKGFLFYRTGGALSKIKVSTNTVTTYKAPSGSANGVTVDGLLLKVASLLCRVINPSGIVTRSQDLEIYSITN